MLFAKKVITMKLKFLYIAFLTFIFAFSITAKNIDKSQPTLTIEFTFTGIVDSCDYLNRINVFIDGEKFATSTEKKQSEANSVTLTVKKGKHKIKVIDEVLFQNKWEEQTLANNYNIDAIYESEIQVKKSMTINLLFDLDKGVSVVP
jgi:hypothetical protein